MNTGLVLPSLRDPRFLFLIIFSLFIYHILNTPAFARDISQLAIISVSCFSFDLLFKFLKGERIFPFSALVSSVGIFAVIDTKYIWVYVLAAFLTIGSKMFLRIKGRHVFNPNNFAIVFTGLFLPSFMSPDGGARWGGDLNWSLVISALGMVLAYQAKRLPVAISFIVFFLLFSLVRSKIGDLHVLLTTSIVFSPGLLVLTYFMITDPRTSPNGTVMQIAFGLAVALTDQLLRLYEIRMSAFIALFTAALVYSIIDLYFRDKNLFESWSYLDFGRAKNEKTV